MLDIVARIVSAAKVTIESIYYMKTVFKCLFLDFQSEILQFNNGRIHVKFGVTFTMFIDIFLNFLYPSYEGFSVEQFPSNTVVLEEEKGWMLDGGMHYFLKNILCRKLFLTLFVCFL